MIDLDDGAGGAQRRLRGQFFHRQNRPAGNVVLVEFRHGLELGFCHRPGLDRGKHLHQPRQARIGRGVVRMSDPGFLADHFADVLPYRRLGDEVQIRVGIVLPALALEDPARLSAAGGVARARHRRAEPAVRMLGVFLHDAGAGQPLLVAQLDATQIQHPVLHRGEHLLPAPRTHALIQGGDDSQGKMQAGTAVADLCTGDERRAIIETGGRSRAAGTLRDVLIDLAVFVRTRTETLDGCDDHARVQLLDPLPGEPHAIERPRRKIFQQYVTALNQALQHLLALGFLGIEGDGALVVVQHGEVETVHVGNVAQLLAGDVSDPGLFHLDDVRPQPGEQLGAGGPRLNVREVENAHTVQCLSHSYSLSPVTCTWSGFWSPGRTRARPPRY